MREIFATIPTLFLIAIPALAGEGVVDWLLAKQGRVNASGFNSYLLQKPSSLLLRWRERGGEWKTLAPWRKSGKNFFAEDSSFSASLSASSHKGGLLISCDVVAKQDLKEPLEILFSSPFQPNRWGRQFYPLPRKPTPLNTSPPQTIGRN